MKILKIYCINFLFYDLIQIIIVESIRTCCNADSKLSHVKIFNFNVPFFVQKLYQYIGILLFIISVNEFFTDLMKHFIGRLRPHFFNVRKKTQNIYKFS
jgi:hypothetical protein